MRWIEFKNFVADNKGLKYPEDVQNIAKAIVQLVERGIPVEDVSSGQVSKLIKLPKPTLLYRAKKFDPRTTLVPKAERPSSPTRGDGAERAIHASLGGAYARTIDHVANRLTWFGDALMGIGSEAFMGYMMSMQLPPEEVSKKLLAYSSPEALVKDFKDYFGSLLRSSEDASALTVMGRKMECMKVLVVAWEWKYEELMKAHFELSKMLSMATSMLSPNQMKRLYLARAIERLGTIDQLTSMPPPGAEGQPAQLQAKEEGKMGSDEFVDSGNHQSKGEE